MLIHILKTDSEVYCRWSISEIGRNTLEIARLRPEQIPGLVLHRVRLTLSGSGFQVREFDSSLLRERLICKTCLARLTGIGSLPRCQFCGNGFGIYSGMSHSMRGRCPEREKAREAGEFVDHLESLDAFRRFVFRY